MAVPKLFYFAPLNVGQYVLDNSLSLFAGTRLLWSRVRLIKEVLKRNFHYSLQINGSFIKSIEFFEVAFVEDFQFLAIFYCL